MQEPSIDDVHLQTKIQRLERLLGNLADGILWGVERDKLVDYAEQAKRQLNNPDIDATTF